VVSIGKYGDLSVDTAPAYFEYGSALLLKEEDNPTNGLLGNVNAEEGAPPPEDEDVDSEDDGPGEASEGEEEGDEEEEEEIDGDRQIAWEVLDVRNHPLLSRLLLLLKFNEAPLLPLLSQVARAILVKEADAATNLLLTNVYMRLGDTNRCNSKFLEAIEEYQQALFICNGICKPYAR
jgi:hypothetical protein